MKRNKRFVLDSNVVISAMLFPGSATGRALKKAFSNGEVMVSDETLSELSAKLSLPKFDKYVPLSLRLLLLQQYEAASVLTKVDEQVALCRDPKDDKFLSLAKSTKADAIISGDSDLLILNPFETIAIISPSDFLKSL